MLWLLGRAGRRGAGASSGPLLFQPCRGTASRWPTDISIPLPGEGRPPLQLSTGRLARLADGAAVAQLGGTAVMAVVCRGKAAPGGQAFLPLTVDYRQKAAAAGRIPANFLRRELGPSEREVLASRLVDRSLRPLAAKGFHEEVGISCNLLALDQQGVADPEVLSVNAASLALSLSSLPWEGAVGAVRVGLLGGRVLINPTRRELAGSRVNLVVVATSSGRCTMLEGEAGRVEGRAFLECVRAGLEAGQEVARRVEELGGREGRPVRRGEPGPAPPAQVQPEVQTLAWHKLLAVFTDHSLDKLSRDRAMWAVFADVQRQCRAAHPAWEADWVAAALQELSRAAVRHLALAEGRRVDGRGVGDLRPISCSVGLHPPLHGSSLFQRGQTQVLCTVALDSLHAAQRLDAMSALTLGQKEKSFMLHYEFPSYATGEVGRPGAGAAGRRELGHGALAERALRQVVPEETQFTRRLTAEVLESNGSSSMASVCGGSLALLDAGVPLLEPASGVAMGLVGKEGGGHRVLTDIMGMEDFLGDMDFKLAATRTGVVAIQADVKVAGIPLSVIEEAVEGGLEANNRILDIMQGAIARPAESKACWPVSRRLEVPAHRRGRLVGPAGLHLRRLEQDTGVVLHPEEEGAWTMFAPSGAAMEEAEERVQQLLQEEKVPELEFGAIYTGRVVEVLDRGVMIQLHESMDPVLLVNSQLASQKIAHPEAIGLAVGQDLQVKYYGRDPASGRIRLSRKVLTVAKASAVRDLQAATQRAAPSPPASHSPSPDPPSMQDRVSALRSQRLARLERRHQGESSDIDAETALADESIEPVKEPIEVAKEELFEQKDEEAHIQGPDPPN